MDSLLVVSKYNEDVSWINGVKCPYIIYDKSKNPIKSSIHRPNIGREAETLLYYIISNYNNLPNLTIFLQGDPRSNPITYTYDEVVVEINKNHKPILKAFMTWEGDIDVNDYWLKSCAILHSLLFEGDTNIKYSSGVQYIIPKSSIVNRPIDLYILLYSLVLKYGNKGLMADKTSLIDGVDAWTLELIWGCIFNEKKILKSNYFKTLLKIIQNEN
jgi:hypothetical protein